ncbi:molybdopterin binding aldehyde oxidase/xanthine dehydrogenase [Gigaspora rosea]|uniref:Molybdopterin binding aldehyde oxidase/xanthine dehydrogenase n=1 Tax=Gigaspora rosea TaxID=44941 RepID=A0A397U7F1_9GLOM|nr:molybdopterin binding aldehyde oxidase/xanthine dehydrogenase [Gigaspora rosea]
MFVGAWNSPGRGLLIELWVALGQVIGLIVAKTKKIAQEAKDLVKIEYEELSHILTIEKAIEQNSEARSGAQEHFYLETNTSLVIPKEDDEFEVHSGCQNPASPQERIADVLGIAANKVTSRVKRVGGAFGRKETKSLYVLTALAVGAWHLRKPKVGLTKDGKILAYDLKLYLNGGGTTDYTIVVAQVSLLATDGCYYILNVRFIGYPCKTNIISTTVFRGFGQPQAVFILESMLYEVAERTGIEVNELREKNLYIEGQKIPYNQTLYNWLLPSVYLQVKVISEFEKRKKEVEEFNSNNKLRKRGLSLLPIKFGISFIAVFMNQAGSLVHIYLNGSVLISHGWVEMGQGLHTKMLQIASEALDVPINTIHLMESATNIVINSSITARSTASDLNGYADHNACKILAKRLKPYREKMPDKSFGEIVKAAYHDRVNLAACSEVEIDTLTGDHTILRTDMCMDLGRSLKYALDVGQIEEGFIQGVGWCTNEQTLHFPNRNLLTTGPDQYKIPVASSKGIGKPPLLLGNTVFFAIRDAITAARLPATPERIRIACDDKIVKKCKVEKKDGEVSWVIEP